MRRSPPSDTALAGGTVAGACAIALAAMGRAVTPLAVALVLSFMLWLGRPAPGRPGKVVPAYVAALLVQVAHLAEEYRTGFCVRFPPLLGAEPWSPRRFLTFNLVWLAVFAAAGVGVARGKRPAYLVAWFLAIGAGVGNGLAHLGLAARAGGYFPGAYTAPLAIVAGGALLHRLLLPAGRIASAARSP